MYNTGNKDKLSSYSLGIIRIRMIELVWLVITYTPLAHPCYTNDRSIPIYYGYELVTWNRVSLLSVFLSCNQHVLFMYLYKVMCSIPISL